jgi:hypothetical protein
MVRRRAVEENVGCEQWQESSGDNCRYSDKHSPLTNVNFIVTQ